ncbi:MAG: DUF2948 family protein [Rhodospirillaceae bacterium]
MKLRAEDAEDLKVLAACLQDAILPVAEIGYLPDEHCFVMVVNRFKWESAGAGGAGERTNSAVTITGVRAVRRRKLDLCDRSLVLDLLTLLPNEDGLDLVFAGGSAIHLTAPHWGCLLEDIGEPWPAAATPHHEVGS